MVNSGTFDTEIPPHQSTPIDRGTKCDFLEQSSNNDEQTTTTTTTSQQNETKIGDEEDERVCRLTNNDDDDMEKASLCCSLPLDKVQDVLNTYQTNKQQQQQSQQQENDTQIKQQTRKLLCLYCDRTFVSVNLREKHTERTHSIKQNKRRQSTRLQQHVTLLKCDYCDKFNTNQHKDLFQHLIVKHSQQYFGCLVCEERFLNEIQLNDHNNALHRSDNEEKSDKVVAVEEEEKMPVKLTRSRMKNKLEEDKRVRKVAVKGSRIALKRSKRLQSKVPEMPKQPPKRTTRKNERKQPETTEVNNEKPSAIQQQNQPNCINPYPEFDHYYRVKKITDHSIDNLKISSLTFDDVFDKAFFNRIKCNIQENLQHYIDGKLFKNLESESRILNFQIGQQIEQPQFLENNFGCDLSLNAVTPVPTQNPLTSQQFGDDFESQIEYGSKAGKKKPDERQNEINYKYFTRRKYQASIQEYKENRDLSKLDMWTQLVIKKRQQKIVESKRTAKETQEYTNGEEYKNKIQQDELNRILDRRGPFEDLKEEVSKRAAFDKLNSMSGSNISEESFAVVREVLNDLLNRVYEMTEEIKLEQKNDSCREIDERVIPSYLNLRPTSSQQSDEIDKSDRIALICSSQETENFELPTNRARARDEVIELTGEWARTRMYICAACGAKLPNMKYLLDHKSIYHQNVWVQHYEFVGNQSELYRHLSIPGLGKVGEVELMQPTKLWKRSDARSCTKCNKLCNTLGELHRHVLECGGDWQWIIARKKCKYKPYGAKSRRKRRGLVKRVHHHHQQKSEPNEKKAYKKQFDGPRPRPSDADTIQRMLANLPAKRSTRKLISLHDGIYKSRKKQQIDNNTVTKNQTTNTKKLKCGKMIYRTNEKQISNNKKTPQTSHRSLRNKVLSSRILDTNMVIKRKLMNVTRITRQTKQQANETNVESKVDVVEEPKRKMPIKRLLSGTVNIKTFFPVVRKTRGRIPIDEKPQETTTAQNKNKPDEEISDDLVNVKNEEDNSTKKRKVTRSFRNVLKKHKREGSVVDVETQEPKKFTFLDETQQNEKIVTPSTILEKNENIVESDPQIVINDCKEDPPIPETIFNLQSNNEANLQAKGELNFDKSDTNLLLIQNEIKETILPTKNGLNITQLDVDDNLLSKKLLISDNHELIVSPMMIDAPKSKPKIRKPSRGLNDCIAMLTSKLQQKEEEEKLKATVSKPATTPPPQPKKECILRIPSFKQHTFTFEEKALDLTTKHYPLIVPQVEKKLINVSESIKYPKYGSIDKIIEAVVENRLADVVKDKTWSSIDDTIQKVVDSCEITRKEVSIQTNTIEVLMTGHKAVYPRNSLDDVIDFVAQGGDVKAKLDEAMIEVPKLKKCEPGKKLKKVKKKPINESNTKEDAINDDNKQEDNKIEVSEKMFIETNLDNVLDVKEIPVAPSSVEENVPQIEPEPEIMENKVVETVKMSTNDSDDDDLPLSSLIGQPEEEVECLPPQKQAEEEEQTTSEVQPFEVLPEKPEEVVVEVPKVVKKRGRPKKVPVNEDKLIQNDSVKIEGETKCLSSEEKTELIGKRGRRKSRASKKIEDNKTNDLFSDFSLVIKKHKTKRITVGESNSEIIEKTDSVEEMDMELDETPLTATIIERQIEETSTIEENDNKLTEIVEENKPISESNLEEISEVKPMPEQEQAEDKPVLNDAEESLNVAKTEELTPKTAKRRKRVRQIDETNSLDAEIKENTIETDNSANCRRKVNRNAKSKALEHILDEALAELTESERNRDIIEEVSEDKSVKKKKRPKSDEIQSDEVEELEVKVSNNVKSNEHEGEEDGLRRSRRSSRKITSYNENELAEPILEILDQTNKRKRKQKPAESEVDNQLSNDKLFDLLKASTDNVCMQKNNKLLENSVSETNKVVDDLEKIYEFTESSPENTLQTDLILKKRNKSRNEEEFDESSKKSMDILVEKVNYCDICNKSFTRIENLIKHKRTLTHISKLSEIEAKEAEEAKAKQLLESETINKPDDNLEVDEGKPVSEPAVMNNFIQQTDSLKLADIINDVMSKPEKVVEEEAEPEFRRLKSLGERKSFDSDKFESSCTPEKQLETQITLLQNIIENQTAYIDVEDESTNTNYNSTKEQEEESFLKPPTHFEEISEDSAQKLRKTLNRDEELFLECCSLLKSGSEVSSNSKKSNKITNLINTDELNKCDEEPDCCWMERKSLTKVNLSDYSDNSRVLTPLGDSCADDASNSNTISSNWEQQQENLNNCDVNQSFTFEEVLQKNDIKKENDIVEEKSTWKDNIAKFGGILTKTLTHVSKKIIKRKLSSDAVQKTSEDISDGGSTCDSKKMLTKGAMKVFEGLKVSIPTEELNMDEVLNGSVKKSDNVSMKTRKSKPTKNKSQIGSKLLFKLNKKNKSNDGKKLNNDKMDQPDVYDFEETQDNSDVFVKPVEFRNNRKKFDESDDNEINQINELNSGSSLSSNGSIKKSKPQQNNTITKKKCMIMGRIFKNAVKSKVDEEIRDIPEMDTEELLENYIANCDATTLDENEPIKHKMSEQEMNLIFDKLLMDTKKQNKVNNDIKKKVKLKRKRQRTNSDSTDDEFNINKAIKKRTNKKIVDNSINLEAELKECIGVASRKSQRKCTSGKQNVLVEYWSSDESAFEALLEETNNQQPVEPKKKLEKKKLTKSQADVASNRRKRTAPNPLYHWSSSSDDEMQGLVEVKPIRDELDDDEEEDEDRPVQHGWIVGDSPKKLVTMLAQAKGSKKIDADCVKEQQIRKKQSNNNNNNNNAIS